MRLDSTAVEGAPALLRAITWFEPDGNLTAELTAMLSDSLRFTRRQFNFMVTGVCVSGVVAVGGLCLPMLTSKRLVTNSRSKVTHHFDACKFHLPLPANQRATQAGDEIHESLRVKILEILAIGSWHDEERVELLFLAIEHDPCAMRIYDRLIRVLGRLKRYHKIHTTLQLGVVRVKALADLAINGRERKRFERAGSSLKIRQDSAIKRATARAIE